MTTFYSSTRDQETCIFRNISQKFQPLKYSMQNEKNDKSVSLLTCEFLPNAIHPSLLIPVFLEKYQCLNTNNFLV